MFHSDSAFATLTSQTLTHEQKLMNLAKEAENAFDVLDIPPRTRHFFETGAINDLFEGHAPYRPRRSWRINQTAPRVEVYMFYYRDTMQHKAIKLMASKLAVAGIIEGSFSEEGLAAMSECEDMTTLMAKELMLGIKDSVEDVSAMFKRMANLKPQAAAWSIFAEAPTAQDETVLVKKAVNEPIVEFTFGNPVPLQTPKPRAFPTLCVT